MIFTFSNVTLSFGTFSITGSVTLLYVQSQKKRTELQRLLFCPNLNMCINM